jgi:hypothetical protein
MRDRILERFGGSRASICFADGQFLEDSTQKMLPRLRKAGGHGRPRSFQPSATHRPFASRGRGLLPGHAWNVGYGEPVPGVLRHERQQSLERVQDRPVVGQWFFRIVAPAELEVK